MPPYPAVHSDGEEKVKPLMSIQKLALAALASEWRLTGSEVIGVNQTYPTRVVLTVSTARGLFAVKVDRQPSPDRATHQILPFLQARVFPHSPQIVPTTNGKYTVTSSSTEITVLEYVPHALTTPDDWGTLGEATARLHQVTDYPAPHVVDPHRAIAELEAWCSDWPFAREYRAILGGLRNRVEPSGLTGLVHGEINLANARRRDNGEVVLLDWDEAGWAPIERELGYPLITVFMDQGTLDFDADSARRFYGAYLASAPSAAIAQDSVWAFALLDALRSMMFYNTEARWARVRRAIERREDLMRFLQPPGWTTARCEFVCHQPNA